MVCDDTVLRRNIKFKRPSKLSTAAVLLSCAHTAGGAPKVHRTHRSQQHSSIQQ